MYYVNNIMLHYIHNIIYNEYVNNLFILIFYLSLDVM